MFVFLNKDKNGASVVLVAVPDGKYTDLFSGETFTVKGPLSLNIPAHGLRALTGGAVKGKPWKY